LVSGAAEVRAQFQSLDNSRASFWAGLVYAGEGGDLLPVPIGQIAETENIKARVLDDISECDDFLEARGLSVWILVTSVQVHSFLP
jgi:hypothetical protein